MFGVLYALIRASQIALVVKKSAGQCRRLRFDPWIRNMPWKAWQPTPVSLPGESHGRRSLAGCGPQGHSQTQLKWLSMHAYTHCLKLYLFLTVLGLRCCVSFSLAVVSGGLLIAWFLSLQSVGSRCAGSVVAAAGL